MIRVYCESAKEEAWFKAAVSGIAEASRCEPYLVGERFAVIKMAGGSVWSGRGLPRTYYPTTYHLVRKGEFLPQGKVIHEGRVLKRDRGKLHFALLEAEEKP